MDTGVWFKRASRSYRDHRAVFYALHSAQAAIALFLSSFAVGANAECLQTRVIPFEANNTVDNTRPTVRWEAVNGATRYRVQLDSRVPEGRRVLFVDTYVAATEFAPPQPLTDYRARVTVSITAECGTEKSPPSAPMRFQIDTSPRCVLLPESIRRDGADIVWSPVERIVSYQVSAYEQQTGNLLDRQELRRERAALSSFAQNAATLSVRPRCQTGWGEAVFVPLARNENVRHP